VRFLRKVVVGQCTSVRKWPLSWIRCVRVCVCMQQSSRPSAHDLAPVGHLDTVVISRPGPRITAAAAAGGGGGGVITGGQLGGSAASQRRRQPSLGRTLRLQETSTRRLRSAYTHTRALARLAALCPGLPG